MPRFIVSTTIPVPTGPGWTLAGNNSLYVARTGLIYTEDVNAGLLITGTGNLVQIDGAIFGNDGLQSTGSSLRLVIGTTGTVIGAQYGMILDGSAEIINFGMISGGLVGLAANGATTITNFGQISGPTGVNAAGWDDVLRNGGIIEGTVMLSAGNDTYDGRGGLVETTIDLGDGNDTALGGDDADWFFDGSGRDEIDSGGGNDTFVLAVDALTDTLDAGSGFDTLRLATFSTANTVDLARGTIHSTHSGTDLISGIEKIVGAAGADRMLGDGFDNVLIGGAGNDQLFGGAGNDRLFGGDDVNTLNGGDGDDRLFGGDWRDTIIGGAGRDRIRGAYDTDQMTGGTGADVFEWRDVVELFQIQSTFLFDRITDFVPGDDRIDLSIIDWDATGPDSSFTFRGTSGINGPGQIAIRQAGASTFVDVSWQAAGAASSIQLTGLLTLTLADFIL